MKIKVKQSDFDTVMSLPKAPRLLPKKPNMFFRTLVRAAAEPDLRAVNFSYTEKDMDKAGNGPYMIFMNHSSFVDLEIASKILYPKPFNIVCTSDGFVGKPGLMQSIGCIPTQKFVSDILLIKDISYTLKTLKSSVLMYPEASYSFDGTATPLPKRLGVLIKRLGAPLVMIKTEGAFTRDPLYNCLQKRKVDVKAEISCLASADELKELSAEDIDAMLEKAFTFDNFAWQSDNKIRINEAFRADGLNRILYKCPTCGCEGKMVAGGVRIHCENCKTEHELDEYGKLKLISGEGRFDHIPDWYAWERSEVKKSLEDGSYELDTDVSIGMMVDYNAIYMVGDGHLRHDINGFTLTGCNGKLNYTQSPMYCYSLYADYFWYELGDIICIGGKDALYYCFPKKPDVVAKTRIAVEELYKINKEKNR